MEQLLRPSIKTTPFERALADITLSALHKRILMERYNTLLLSMESRVFRISVFFHASRAIVTVGSLIVPALLSIQYTNSGSANLGIYWTTWVFSLLVTVCNGMMTLLKLDKTYYHLHTVYEQLISDGWQYLELTGKYSGFHTPHHHPTHENQFIFFCHSVEKIRMQQIQEEYVRVTETSQQGTQQTKEVAKGTTAAPPSMLPPTPQQGELTQIPESIKIVMEELSKAPIGDGQEIQEGSRKNTQNTTETTSGTNEKR
jgi:hypothetical protein